MRALVTAYLAGSVVGAVHSVRRRRHARFAGLQFPGTPFAHAVTIGSPLSAPPAILITLVVAERTGRSGLVKALSALFLIGIAAEADTLATLRHPSKDPLSTTCVVLDVALPAAMLVAVRRSTIER